MLSLLRSERKERGVKRRFSEEQIIAILREGETAPTKAEVCRKYGISEWTYYRWQRQYRGLEVDHLRRLKQLEQASVRLKKLGAEHALANEAVKEVLEKRGLR
jgi:putative transposase